MLLRTLLLGLTLLCSPLAYCEEYWIDVRIPEQYVYEHIDGAINIPLRFLPDTIYQVAKNKDDQIHLYCNTGNQSNIGKELLTRMGYTNIIDEGGLPQAKQTFYRLQQP